MGEITERLVRLGATIFSGHQKENVSEVDVVVTSSAVRADNPEVVEAKRLGIPVIPRAEMLAEIMRGKTGIAVAGTHGKTTTTSMTAQILIEAGLDPTVVVGGKVEAIGSNAKMGQGNVVVVEADESDGSFHLLPATHGIITNIDLDHMEHYLTRENLDGAFVKFTKKIPFYGCTWLCADDPGVQKILPELTKPFYTYGLAEEADLFARDVRVHGSNQQTYTLYHRKERGALPEKQGEIELSVLGAHNVLNSLAAIGMSFTLGAPFTAAKTALRNFKHVRRRFDERYFSLESGIRVIDDYGHHPTEVRAVLATAQQTNPARIVTFFQPHRYTRTQLCWNEFLTCFENTDVLILLPIYAASEDPIEGVSSARLADAIRNLGGQSPKIFEVSSLEEALKWVTKEVKAGDLILTLGAGSITKLSEQIAKQLS